jgi:hypothetical protein
MELQALPCYCATLRQAARTATSFYEQALADWGVRATQFTIMQVLKTAPGIQTTEVATLIGLDQTTATRTLALMSSCRNGSGHSQSSSGCWGVLRPWL